MVDTDRRFRLLVYDLLVITVVVVGLTSCTVLFLLYFTPPFPSNKHHRSNGDCLEGTGKIIMSVVCNIVCNICAQCNAHTYEQT